MHCWLHVASAIEVLHVVGPVSEHARMRLLSYFKPDFFRNAALLSHHLVFVQVMADDTVCVLLYPHTSDWLVVGRRVLSCGPIILNGRSASRPNVYFALLCFPRIFFTSGILMNRISSI